MARKNRLRIHSASSRGKGAGKKILFTLLALMVVGVAVAGFILFETEGPRLEMDKELTYLGGPVDIAFQAVDQRSGINAITITLKQESDTFQLFHRSFQRRAWFTMAGPSEVQETIRLNAQKAGAKEGKAELIIVVTDFSLKGMLKGNSTVTRYPVTIDTKAPKVTVQHSQQYIRPGGSGIVVYEISEPSVRHGVSIDASFFPGFPLHGRDKSFISYIALPWDSKRLASTQVIAADQAGNEGKATFTMNLKKAKEKKDRINVSDDFLNKKIPEFQEFYPEMQGTNLEKYLFVNNTVRNSNAAQITQICSATDPDQLWQDRFIRMPGAGRAGFADQRTYYYQGKAIDHQTHLGVDIASTAQVAIKAANKGKVIFADYLGIYGNMVILDHGQGLSSLYSHLSSIDTTIDKMVDKGELIGRSGVTGMAGGDHLHYSMLVNGTFVTPVEWWDQHWIDVNINNTIN